MRLTAGALLPWFLAGAAAGWAVPAIATSCLGWNGMDRDGRHVFDRVPATDAEDWPSTLYGRLPSEPGLAPGEVVELLDGDGELALELTLLSEGTP